MKVKLDTIVRLVVLVFTVINTLLGYIGVTPIDLDEHSLYTIVSAIAVVLVPLYAAWKNNSLTTPALIADEYLRQLRKVSKELEEGEGNDVSEVQ